LWLTGALSVQMPRNSERLVKQLTFANASAELLEAYSDRELSVNENYSPPDSFYHPPSLPFGHFSMTYEFVRKCQGKET